MIVDHPFLFVVFDATTGLILCQVVVSEIPETGA
jgi:serine protease inhibitor